MRTWTTILSIKCLTGKGDIGMTILYDLKKQGKLLKLWAKVNNNSGKTGKLYKNV